MAGKARMWARRLAAGVLVLPLAVVAGAASPRGGADQPSAAARTPILMELFTSEGCSSCPPADNWVESLDAEQPLAGAEVIVLSEHVDYWDHDGWKDPYSSAALTDRQKAYMNALGGKDIYTPQLIVDGFQELKLADGEQVRDELEHAAATPMMPVRIEQAALAAGTPGILTGKIDADGSAEKHGGDVYLAVALDKTLTDVLAGENDGKKLTNVAVVKELTKVGKLEKGKNFDGPFRVKLWAGADPANLRVIAFVQESGPGKVLGAAMTKEIGKGE
jgi:hypothetical protein